MADNEQMDWAVNQIEGLMGHRHRVFEAKHEYAKAVAAVAEATIAVAEAYREQGYTRETFNLNETEQIYREAAANLGLNWDSEEFDTYRMLLESYREAQQLAGIDPSSN